MSTSTIMEIRLNSRTRGFTLLEVMLVLVLMAILSAITVVRLGGVKGKSELKDAVQEAAFFDQLVREDAIRSNEPATLVFDLDHQEILWMDGANQTRGQKFHLTHDGIRIEKLMTAVSSGSGTVESNQTEFDEIATGKFSMPCSVQGITHSYAVTFSGPHNQKLWLFVAGMTGQSRVFDKDQPVKDLLELHANP